MKFELNIMVKIIISGIIERKAIKRTGYYEFIGNTKLVNKYGIENCGAVFMNSSIYIIWDETFYNKLSSKERLFCRYHELGHFTGHKSLSELLSHERQLTEEVKADSYAFKKMGYNDALESMMNILNYLDEYQTDEMNQRINIQKSMNIAKQVIRNNI
jgi:hypothetical protein